MRKDKIFSLRLTRAMREALGAVARRDRRSIGSLVEKIIADYLAKEEIQWEQRGAHENRRSYPRRHVSLPARLTIQQASEVFEETEALIENMSRGGSYVTYTNGQRPSWELQAPIRLIVRIPGAPGPMELECRAVRVIRDEQRVSVGLQYLGVGRENLDLIDRFLHGSRKDATSFSYPS
jgi:hypothetical protein